MNRQGTAGRNKSERVPVSAAPPRLAVKRLARTAVSSCASRTQIPEGAAASILFAEW